MDWSYSGIAGARRAQAYEGEVTLTPFVKHYPPDTHAASLWLRNRQSKRWRDRIEHTGADGGPISLETIDRRGQDGCLSHQQDVARRRHPPNLR
jgi:hypothetical protein